MASAMRVFRKFRASDGRIKIATLSGVSALVAVIALLVGVLPVFATDGDSDQTSTDEGVPPVQVEWGGGSGACDDVLTPVDGGDDRGPSTARYELHINNPVPGTSTPYTGPDGTQITITVDENDKFFGFNIEGKRVAYDAVANGGKKSNHYAYDDPDPTSEIVPLDSDSHLSAPTKDNKDEVHKLSHINLCYDVQPVEFECDAEDPTHALDFGSESFDGATATIFANHFVDCDDKSGRFFIDGDEATLDFGTDDGVLVAGRADFTKEFGEPTAHEDFDDLQYDRDGSGDFVDVAWCETRKFVDGEDGDQFSDWLPTTGDDASYPELPDGETACKVAEDEDLSGTQVTVVYFEFEDPQFQ